MSNLQKYFIKINMQVICLASLLSISSIAIAAPPRFVEVSLTAQPTEWEILGRPSLVSGYSNAHFGMDEAQVRSIIDKDYPLAMSSLKTEQHATNRTKVTTIVVNELVPGPGPATITYVFGASSQKLIAVNVYWLVTGVASTEQQQQLKEAASKVTAGLLGYRWPLMAVSRGIVPEPGTLVVFSGKDFAGGGVEVRLNGVGFHLEKFNATAQSAGSKEYSPASPGPAQLHLSFVANIENPDVY